MNIDAVANVLAGALGLFALVLSIMAARAWAYARESRSLFLLLGFLVLLAKAVTLLAGLFLLTDWTRLLPASLAFDLALAASFYLASLR